MYFFEHINSGSHVYTELHRNKFDQNGIIQVAGAAGGVFQTKVELEGNSVAPLRGEEGGH